MTPGERAELERQGAKAAARGDGEQSNPMLLEANTPASTGESLHEWSARHDAWACGYDSQRLIGFGPSSSRSRRR